MTKISLEELRKRTLDAQKRSAKLRKEFKNPYYELLKELFDEKNARR